MLILQGLLPPEQLPFLTSYLKSMPLVVEEPLSDILSLQQQSVTQYQNAKKYKFLPNRIPPHIPPPSTATNPHCIQLPQETKNNNTNNNYFSNNTNNNNFSNASGNFHNTNNSNNINAVYTMEDEVRQQPIPQNPQEIIRNAVKMIKDGFKQLNPLPSKYNTTFKPQSSKHTFLLLVVDRLPFLSSQIT